MFFKKTNLFWFTEIYLLNIYIYVCVCIHTLNRSFDEIWIIWILHWPHLCNVRHLRTATSIIWSSVPSSEWGCPKASVAAGRSNSFPCFSWSADLFVSVFSPYRDLGACGTLSTMISCWTLWRAFSDASGSFPGRARDYQLCRRMATASFHLPGNQSGIYLVQQLAEIGCSCLLLLNACRIFLNRNQFAKSLTIACAATVDLWTLFCNPVYLQTTQAEPPRHRKTNQKRFSDDSRNASATWQSADLKWNSIKPVWHEVPLL